MEEQAKRNNVAISEMLVAIGLLIVISVFQIIIIFTANLDELVAGDVVPYALVFIGVAIAASLILFFIFKSLSKAAFFGCIFIMLFINYRYIEGLIQFVLPRARYWHIAPTMIILYVLLVRWVAKIMPSEVCKKICVAILISFGLLTLLNISMSIPAMVEQAQTGDRTPQTTEQAQAIGQADQPLDLPNIYYFILDEYGGFEVLENLYNYSNSDFYAFLRDNNFEVSRSSRNSSLQTRRILVNLLNLDYIDYQFASSSELQQRKLEPNALYTLLESFGYNIRGVGSTEYVNIFSESNNVRTEVEARTIDGQNIEALLLGNTIIYPFFQRVLTGWQGEEVLNAFEFMNTVDNIPSEHTFTFFYIVSPHQPFLFDRNGNPVNARDHDNWADPQFYLGQLQYITRLTTQTVEFLLEQDPDSIIILQSDHGPRFFTGSFHDHVNILNAVYFRGEPISEINGLSGVNTLRVILSRLLDLDMPVLEVPR